MLAAVFSSILVPGGRGRGFLGGLSSVLKVETGASSAVSDLGSEIKVSSFTTMTVQFPFSTMYLEVDPMKKRFNLLIPLLPTTTTSA